MTRKPAILSMRQQHVAWVAAMIFGLVGSAHAGDKRKQIEEVTVLADMPAITQPSDKYAVPSITEDLAMSFNIEKIMKPKLKTQ